MVQWGFISVESLIIIQNVVIVSPLLVEGFNLFLEDELTVFVKRLTAELLGIS